MNGNTSYTYILRCRDGSLYTGYTTDMPRRMRAHVAGKGGHYTRAHPPAALAMVWRCDSATGARRLEYAIKHRLSAEQKRDLIAAPEQVCALFSELCDYQFEPIQDPTLSRILEEKP